MNSMHNKSLKILSIGNSFSVDSQEYLYDIATDLGYNEVVLGNLYIGGCALNTHLSNAQNDTAAYTYYYNGNGTWTYHPDYKMSTALKSQDWDYITIQQASSYSGLPDSYSSLDPLMDIVKTMSGDAKFAWNMTWTYQKDYQWGFGVYETQENMYQQLTSAVKNKIATRDDFYAIIPNGTAIQNARTSYLGDTLTRDGSHLSLDAGRYIAALNFFYTLTGDSIDDISYVPEGVNKNMKKVCIESVKNAVEAPFNVTKSVNLTRKVLFVGNSATSVNDVPATLVNLAGENGVLITQKQVLIGGATLKQHVEDGTVLKELQTGDYDNIFVQENSIVMTSEQAQMECTQACNVLNAEAKKYGTKFCIYVRPPQKVNYGGFTTVQQSKVLDEYFTPLAQNLNATNAYVNRSIALASQTLPYELWAADQAHMSIHGSYLVICTFYATLFKRSATELDTAYDIPLNEAKKLQKIADKIVMEDYIPW